jgi:hypothetical protein
MAQAQDLIMAKKKGPALAFQDDALLDANPLVVNRTLDQMKRVGAKNLRINAIWGQVRKPDGTYDFGKLDSLVNAARIRGIAPQMTLMGTPSYMKARNLDMTLSADTPNVNLMQQFAHDAATHFKGRVGRYSIWNEPNISSFLSEGENKGGPGQYRHLYQAGFKGVKGVDPHAQVLLGELTSGIAGGAKNQQALAFLRNVIGAGKKPLLADGLALHPYQWSNPNKKIGNKDFGGIGNLQAVQAELLREFHRGKLATPGGKSKVPLYLTEFGYRKRDFPNDTQRARYTAAAYKLAQKAGAKEFLQYQFLPTTSTQSTVTNVQDPAFQVQGAYGQMRQVTPPQRSVFGTAIVPSNSTWDTSITDTSGGLSAPYRSALLKMRKSGRY